MTHNFNPTVVTIEIEWCMPLIPVVHTFDPSPREEIRQSRTALRYSLLRFQETGSPFQTEVKVRASGWLLCFSDLQVEHQFLIFSFY